MAAQTAQWRALLGQADILWDLPAAEDLPAATRLRWVQTTSTGVGPAVAKLGLDRSEVIVTTARGVHAGPLAEFVFMALLAHWRGLAHLQAEQRAHRWVRYCGEGVAGRTVVTIGAGDLAMGVARVARGLSMRTVAVARDAAKPRPGGAVRCRAAGPLNCTRAVAQADAVVVTLPHTADTERLVDAAGLRRHAGRAAPSSISAAAWWWTRRR